LAAALAACGTDAAVVEEGDRAAQDLSEQDKVVNVSNWPLYIDVDADDESVRPTVDAFTAKTGIKVNYTEDVNDNVDFFGKVRNQLAAGQDTGRDLIVLTDWMAARMIRLGWVQELDKANLGQVGTNLIPSLQAPGFDPQRAFTVLWQSGMTGIAYNAAVTGELRTMTELLTRADLKGKVTLLSEMRDTVGLVLLEMGKDPADFTADDYAAAIAMVQAAVDSGQVRRFTGNDYAEELASGNVAACTGWSGDVTQLQFDSEDVRFVIPEAGAMLFSDNSMVPNQAQHKAAAEAFMDYYYDPEVAAQLAAYVNYICPVAGAKEAMEAIDPALAANPLIFPDEATLARTHVFRGLSEDEESSFDDQFQRMIGA